MGELKPGLVIGNAGAAVGKKLIQPGGRTEASAVEPGIVAPTEDTNLARPASQGRIPASAPGLRSPDTVTAKAGDPLEIKQRMRLAQKQIDADVRAGRYRAAAQRLQDLAALQQQRGDALESYRALEQAAELLYEHEGILDAACMLAADDMLQTAERAAASRPGSPEVLAAERKRFETRWQQALQAVWQRHRIPTPLPADWRDALDNPVWQEPLRDVNGVKAARLYLERDARRALQKSQELLKQGEAQTAVKAQQMGGEILSRANKDLQAGVAFLEAAQMAYDRLEVISPELFFKAERSLRQAAARPQTAAEAQQQLDKLNKLAGVMLERLWREWKLPETRPASWQETLGRGSLYPYFYDAHGNKEGAYRQARAAAAQHGKFEDVSVWQTALDISRTIGGILADNAEKYIIDPVKVAYDYYTDPQQRKNFLSDAAAAGRIVGSGVARAAVRSGKVLVSPFEAAYQYYTSPRFSFENYLRDIKDAGHTLGHWVQGDAMAVAAPVPVGGDRHPISARLLDELIAGATDAKTSRDRLHLFVDGKEAREGILELIHEAQKSITVQMFMFHNDRSGYEVADALIQKARQGVKVRVLYDKLGTWLVNSSLASSPGSHGNIIHYLQENGVEVQAEKNSDLDGDHTKLIVSDGKSAITGGMNFGNHYNYEWHDFMIRVDGPAVEDMQQSFIGSWHRAERGGKTAEFPANVYFSAVDPDCLDDAVATRVLYTTPQKKQIKDAMFTAIRNAQHHINVEIGYVTDDEFVEELIKARRRGVDVRVILPVKSDSSIYDRSNLVSLNRLVANGVRVYLYSRTIHGKAMTVDGVWATIGSANASRRSLNANQEINIGIADPDYVRHIDQRIFEVDMKPERSKPVEDPIPRQLWDRMLDWGARQASQFAAKELEHKPGEGMLAGTDEKTIIENIDINIQFDRRGNRIAPRSNKPNVEDVIDTSVLVDVRGQRLDMEDRPQDLA